jgi:GDP-L-fucose synthase
VVSGSGKPLRQFIFNEDLGKLILWSLFEYDCKETIILSPPENHEVSIKNIANQIANIFNYDNIIFDTNKSDGQFKKTADNNKLMSHLKNFNFTNIDIGLKISIEWFLDNYQNARK